MKRKKIGQLFIRLIISFAILVILFYGMKDNLVEIKENIFSLNILLFSFAVFLYLGISILGAYRLNVLMTAHEIKLPFIALLKNMYIGYLFNLFLLGSTGGDAVRSYYIAKETHRKTEVITLIFFDRLIGMTTMMCIALSSLLFNLQHAKMKSLAFAVMFLLFSVIVFFVLLLNKELLKRFPFVQKIADKLFFKETLKKIYETMYFFKNHKRKILFALILSVVIQSLAIIVCYTVSCSLTRIGHIPLRHFFLLMPIIFMGSALPVSIGGWGVFEMGFVVCFGFLGYSRGAAFSLGLMNHFVLIILGLIGICIYLMPGTEHIASQAIDEGIENLDEESEMDYKKEGELL